MPSVVVADDHALFRRGVCDVLRSAGMHVAAEAEDGAGAIQAVRDHTADVLLLDLHMPDTSGLEVLRALPRPVPVLVLTVSDADEDLHAAIRAGAAGYLLKSARPDQIVDAVQAVATGKGALSPEVAARVLRAARDAPPPNAPALSEQENAVARLIAHGCSNRAIAARLGISHHTVKTYVGRIFEKYGVHTRVEIALRLRDTGWPKVENTDPG